MKHRKPRTMRNKRTKSRTKNRTKIRKNGRTKSRNKSRTKSRNKSRTKSRTRNRAAKSRTKSRNRRNNLKGGWPNFLSGNAEGQAAAPTKLPVGMHAEERAAEAPTKLPVGMHAEGPTELPAKVPTEVPVEEKEEDIIQEILRLKEDIKKKEKEENELRDKIIQEGIPMPEPSRRFVYHAPTDFKGLNREKLTRIRNMLLKRIIYYNKNITLLEGSIGSKRSENLNDIRDDVIEGRVDWRVGAAEANRQEAVVYQYPENIRNKLKSRAAATLRAVKDPKSFLSATTNLLRRPGEGVTAENTAREGKQPSATEKHRRWIGRKAAAAKKAAAEKVDAARKAAAAKKAAA